MGRVFSNSEKKTFNGKMAKRITFLKDATAVEGVCCYEGPYFVFNNVDVYGF